MIELFCCLLRLRRYERKSVEVAVFWRIFDSEGGIAHHRLLVSENYRVVAVSCGTKISAVRHLILSQYTRLTDGQTDGQMD